MAKPELYLRFRLGVAVPSGSGGIFSPPVLISIPSVPIFIPSVLTSKPALAVACVIKVRSRSGLGGGRERYLSAYA